MKDTRAAALPATAITFYTAITAVAAPVGRTGNSSSIIAGQASTGLKISSRCAQLAMPGSIDFEPFAIGSNPRSCRSGTNSIRIRPSSYSFLVNPPHDLLRSV